MGESRFAVFAIFFKKTTSGNAPASCEALKQDCHRSLANGK
jgi:hypothetical protein